MNRLLQHRSSPGDVYYRQVQAMPLLGAEEERHLAEQARTGDRDARDRLVQAHLRLVVSVARRYLGRGLSLADLVEEGNLGLLRAVRGFDPVHGVRFGVYATFWIKQAIRRALLTTTRPILRARNSCGSGGKPRYASILPSASSCIDSSAGCLTQRMSLRGSSPT